MTLTLRSWWFSWFAFATALFQLSLNTVLLLNFDNSRLYSLVVVGWRSWQLSSWWWSWWGLETNKIYFYMMPHFVYTILASFYHMLTILMVTCIFTVYCRRILIQHMLHLYPNWLFVIKYNWQIDINCQQYQHNCYAP